MGDLTPPVPKRMRTKCVGAREPLCCTQHCDKGKMSEKEKEKIERRGKRRRRLGMASKVRLRLGGKRECRQPDSNMTLGPRLN